MIHNVFDEIEQMEIPVIAAINGVAAAAGSSSRSPAISASPPTAPKMGLPENNVGLIPGSGGISRLVKLVGPSKAKRLVMTGEIVPVEKALAYGLIDEVVPADGLIDHAARLRRSNWLPRRRSRLGTAKLVINQCANVDLETGRNFERIGQSVLKLTDDHVEGAKAFVEKRKPDFKGR